MTKKKAPVKRTYTSPLREEHARATKQAIVDVAAALFAQKGYAAVSMDDVAEVAGVGRATVFKAVGGKPALLREAYAAVFARAAGGGEGVPLVQRPRALALFEEKDARRYLAGYAALATDISSHLAQLNEVVREAAASDAEARELFDTRYAERRRGADTIVRHVKERGGLREDVDPKELAEIVWLLNDPYTYFMLVVRSGWTKERYEQWLFESLATTLLRR